MKNRFNRIGILLALMMFATLTQAQNHQRYHNSLRFQYGLYQYNSNQSTLISDDNNSFLSAGLTYRQELGRLSAIGYTARFYEFNMPNNKDLSTYAFQAMYMLHPRRISSSWQLNRVLPYIGAGIGFETHKLATPTTDSSFSNFYIPFEAGLMFNISSRWSVGLFAEYKLSSAKKLKDISNVKDGATDIVNTTGITLSYHFGHNYKRIMVPVIYTHRNLIPESVYVEEKHADVAVASTIIVPVVDSEMERNQLIDSIQFQLNTEISLRKHYQSKTDSLSKVVSFIQDSISKQLKVEFVLDTTSKPTVDTTTQPQVLVIPSIQNDTAVALNTEITPHAIAEEAPDTLSVISPQLQAVVILPDSIHQDTIAAVEVIVLDTTSAKAETVEKIAVENEVVLPKEKEIPVAIEVKNDSLTVSAPKAPVVNIVEVNDSLASPTIADEKIASPIIVEVPIKVDTIQKIDIQTVENIKKPDTLGETRLERDLNKKFDSIYAVLNRMNEEKYNAKPMEQVDTILPRVQTQTPDSISERSQDILNQQSSQSNEIDSLSQEIKAMTVLINQLSVDAKATPSVTDTVFVSADQKEAVRQPDYSQLLQTLNLMSESLAKKQENEGTQSGEFDALKNEMRLLRSDIQSLTEKENTSKKVIVAPLVVPTPQPTAVPVSDTVVQSKEKLFLKELKNQQQARDSVMKIQQKSVENLLQQQTQILDELEKAQQKNEKLVKKMNAVLPDTTQQPTDSIVLTVSFASNSIEVGTKYVAQLSTIAEKVKSNNQQKILLAGYADKYGNPDYNLKISQRRVQSVKKELIQLGVKTDQILEQSFGSMRASESTVKTDRRVEIKMLR